MYAAFRRKIATAGLLALAVLATSAWGAPPTVLQQVPEDIGTVLVVRDLREFAGKLNNMATRLNIPAPPDLLTVFSQRIGLAKGLDQGGSAAIFWTPLPKDAAPERRADREAPFVMLLPTTDAKAMLEPYKPTDPAEGISSVTLPNQDNPPEGFVALVNKDGKPTDDPTAATYVAFATSKPTLRQYLAHTKSLAKALGAEEAKAFEANDVVFYANVPAFAEQAQGGLAMVRMLIQAQMANAAGDDEKKLALQERSTGLVFDGLKRVLTDGQVALVTFRLNDNGAALGLRTRFAPASPIGKFFAAQKPLAAVNLDGLPAGELYGAADMTWDPVTFSDALGQFGAQFTDIPELAKDPDMVKMKKNLELQKQMMALVTGAKMAFYKPADPKESGFLKGVGIMQTTDPAKFLALQREGMKNISNFANPQMPELLMTATSKEKALTVKDANGKEVVLDQHTLKFELKPTPGERIKPEVRQGFKIIEAMYGKNGTTFYTGELSPNQVIFLMGADEKFAQEAVAGALGGANPLTNGPELNAVRQDILPNPSLVMLLPVDRWVALAMGLAQDVAPAPAPEAAPPPPAMPGGAPVAISVAPAGAGISVELFVPTTVVNAIMSEVRK